VRFRDPIAALLLTACAPQIDAALPEGEPAKTYLYFDLNGDDSIAAVHAYTSDEAARVLELEATTHLLVLEYDQPLDTIAFRGADATVRASVDQPSNDAWPLLMPRRASELVPGSTAFVARDLESLRPWVARIFVERPPCLPAPLYRRIEGIAGGGDLSFVLRWRDELIVGVAPDMDRHDPAAVYRLPVDGRMATPIPPLKSAMVNSPAVPLGYLDGDTLWVQWAMPAVQGATVYELVGVDLETGAVRDRYVPDGLLPGLLFETLAHGFGTVIGRGRVYSENAEPQPLVLHLDLAKRAWVVMLTATSTDTDACARNYGQMITEIDAPEQGLIGVVNGPISRFDLNVPGFIVDAPTLSGPGPYCRNARTFLPDGTEILAFVRPNGGLGQLWRSPGGAWEPFDVSTEINAHMLASIGHQVLAGGLVNLAAILERSPARPELPPRQCHEISLSKVRLAIAVDEHTLFAGGSNASNSGFLDFAPP